MKKIRDNYVQLIEIIILLFVLCAPAFIDVKGMFGQYVAQTSIDPDNAFLYILLQHSNWIIGGVFSVIVWWFLIRKYNRENITMNKANVYHEYPYWWYWFSAVLLDIRRCNLVNVPIYMQVKLVVNNLFDEFPLDEKSYTESEDEVKIEKKNFKKGVEPSEVNLIIEDTYPIENRQIPREKKHLPTIRIYREREAGLSRHYSKHLVDLVGSEVRKLPEKVELNLYATMNPMNTMYVSKGAFIMANRGNVKHLYVFQQRHINGRHFSDKRKKIY